MKIAVTGIIGEGKSTMSRRFADFLVKRGYRVELRDGRDSATYNPSGSSRPNGVEVLIEVTDQE